MCVLNNSLGIDYSLKGKLIYSLSRHYYHPQNAHVYVCNNMARSFILQYPSNWVLTALYFYGRNTITIWNRVFIFIIIIYYRFQNKWFLLLLREIFYTVKFIFSACFPFNHHPTLSIYAHDEAMQMNQIWGHHWNLWPWFGLVVSCQVCAWIRSASFSTNVKNLS